MSNMLFDKIKSSLVRELKDQLSPRMMTIFKDVLGDNNLLYKIADRDPSFSTRDIVIMRQINDFDKKFIGKSKDTVNRKIRDSACWDSFIQANNLCGDQNQGFEHLDSNVMETLELARIDIYNAFWKHAESEKFEFDWCKLNDSKNEFLVPVSGFSSGPGTCTGVVGTSVLEKYREAWHTSSELGKRLLLIIRRYSVPIQMLPKFVVELVSSVKAKFVPKKSTASRMIAPQLNGDLFLQYPAESCLRNMLLFFGIDLETQQDKNRRMAREGSTYDNMDMYDRHLKRRKMRACTIDLTSASDIVGWVLCNFLNPVPLQEYLMSCRSELLVTEDDQSAILNMMATMGNAYCFPLQTMVFCSFVRAIYRRLGLPLLNNNGEPNYGVYGDDIIVDIAAYDEVIKLLKCLKMVPNVKKSFSHGLFRESCGGDFYNGYNVRPVMVETLKTDNDLYSLSNRLLDWSAAHSIDVSATVSLLLAKVKYKVVVPMDFGPHQGLRVPESFLSSLPLIWRKNLVCSASVSFSSLERHWTYFSPFFKARNPNIRFINHYTSYSGECLNSIVPWVHLKLAKGEKSLFPFLRGGVKQMKRGNIVKVPYKSSGSFSSRELWQRSIWDVPVQYVPEDEETRETQVFCYSSYFGFVYGYYSSVLARLSLDAA